MFQSLLLTKPWLRDPDVINVPWKSDKEYHRGRKQKGNRLPFGLMETDGMVSPHPPIARALRMVAEALKAEGHGAICSHSVSSAFKPDVIDRSLRGSHCLMPNWQ
jgi:amidase